MSDSATVVPLVIAFVSFVDTFPSLVIAFVSFVDAFPSLVIAPASFADAFPPLVIPMASDSETSAALRIKLDSGQHRILAFSTSMYGERTAGTRGQAPFTSGRTARDIHSDHDA